MSAHAPESAISPYISLCLPRSPYISLDLPVSPYISLQAPRRIALYAAAASVVSKELLYRVTRRVGLKMGSSVIIANAWHHRSDALSSVVAIVGEP